MKTETFPIFYKDVQNKQKGIDTEVFIQQLTALPSMKELRESLKEVEENIRILSKQPDNDNDVLMMVNVLTNIFQRVPAIQILTLIRGTISPDVKFQAKNQATDDVLSHSENIRNIASNEPIALPCDAAVAYGPQLPPSGYAGPTIAMHDEQAMSDVTDQKKQSDAKTYFNIDNQIVQQYISKPFKVIKRQGISQLFTKSVEIITTGLMESYLQTNFLALPAQVIAELLKLLEYISPSIYSFHLLNIAKVITDNLLLFLDAKETEKKLSKEQFQSIRSSFNTIAQRWVDSPSFNIELWNWQTQSRMINLFIKSQISQKKLFAVKTLGQICRKSSYFAFIISPQKIKEFIVSKSILEEIFRADNHPEVIAKGEEVFIYMSKNESLTKELIDLLFNLIEKCHENLSKSLFATLQKVQQKSIENYREYLLQKIEELPRPNCFNEQTFLLIKRIVLMTPSEQIQSSLLKIYRIIEKNYEKLRQNLRAQSITLYYEVYIMGIQLGIFNQTNALSPLKLLLDKPESTLYLRMIEAFIFRLKDKTYHHNYGHTCRKTLHEGIKQLIREQKIHELKLEDSQNHLKILMLLLSNYQQMDNELLSHQQLWKLIKIDNKFTKFIRYYSEAIQIEMISSLIKIQNKSSHDLQCIIDLYHLMTMQVRQKLEPLILEEYYSTSNIITKYTLAPEVLKIESTITFSQIFEFISKGTSDHLKLISWLILARQILKNEDQKGYGDYPPLSCLNNSYDVSIKVSRYNSDYKQTKLQVTGKSYNTLFEIVKKILTLLEQPFEKSKIKLNDKYLEMQDLKEIVSSFIGYKNITMDVYQTKECEWFDKAQLFDRDNFFKQEISDCLKEVFFKYSPQKVKLTAQNIAQIFKIATSNQYISEHDSRVHQILNVYSQNGKFLTLDQWMNFYYRSAQQNAPLVVSNLINLGYSEIFNKLSSFEEIFFSSQNLRKSIVSSPQIYEILFEISRQTVTNCSNQQLLATVIDEIIKTMNLLPTYQSLLDLAVENKPELFKRHQTDQLLHWYISRITKSLYSEQIKIDNAHKWKTLFFQSSNLNTIKELYVHYLQLLFKKGTDKIAFNKDILLTILQNFGIIIRQGLTSIPNLTTFNYDEASPLTFREVDPFFNNVAFTLDGQAIDKLSNLCLSTFKAKGSTFLAENSAAVIVHFLLKQLKVDSTFPIKVEENLVLNQKPLIRGIFNAFYFLLSNVSASIKNSYYLFHLNLKEKNSSYCKEYFNALCKMMSFQEDDSKYNELSQAFQKDIASYSFSHQAENFGQTDEILLGKLRVLNYIKLYSPKIAIQSSTIESIKILLEINSSEETRQILYSMSSSVCSLEQNLKIMQKVMNNIKLSRNSNIRGKNKMGLQNLGCTCYINSVIQQLQMIEPFRLGIINTQVQQNSVDFFRQFQYMLYQLTFGQRIYFIPDNFCLNYLDSNGNPVNTKEQHDADEFLNQLFDRLQNRLKITNEASLIGDNFKGEVVNVINCDICFQKKERVESFYILSVQIKNLKTLPECINKYAEPEIICDYFCQFCDKKVETIQKYHKFHSLPPFLFIHLQRLVFDLEFMYKIKLDHPIDFPNQLDLSQFFNTSCSEPAIYTLKGFVVHIGSSQGGHYYSLIKCQDQWIKFDDTRIDVWKWEDGSYDRNNAYMFIYEKKQNDKKEMKPQVKIGNNFVMEEIKQDNISLLKQKIFLQPSFNKFLLQNLTKLHIPQQFSTDMSELFKPFHPNYHEMPNNLGEQLDLIFHIIFKYFKLQAKSRQLNIRGNNIGEMSDNQNVQKQITEFQKAAIFLLYILHFRPHFAYETAKQFIESSQSNPFSLIYTHREQEVRQIAKTLLFKVFSILKSESFTNFIVPVPQNELIQKLLQKVIVSLCQVGKNPSKMTNFFELIVLLIRSDNKFGQWFQCNKLGPRLIHFMLQNESPLSDVFPSYPFYSTTSRKQGVIAIIIEIISLLICFEKELTYDCSPPSLENKAYLNFQLYRRIFQDRYDNESIPNIINFCCKNNLEFTNKVIPFLIQALNRFNHTDRYIYTYLNVMLCLLNLEDGYQRERIERLLGVPLPWKKYEKEGEEYMIKKDTDRYCRYQNSCEKKGDEIYLSFLQLLYTNRKEQNYFVLFGIAALLKLMTTNPTIEAYIQNLPGPCGAYPSYIEWITQFIYDSEKMKKQMHKDISSEDLEFALKEIASLINKFENVESDSGENAESRHLLHLAKNKPYIIGQTFCGVQWTQIPFAFSKNLIVKEPIPEELADIKQSQIVRGEYRIVFGKNQEDEQVAQLIEFKFYANCKAKIWFTSGFNYTLFFEQNAFEFALPFFQDPLSAMIYEVPEGQLKKVLMLRKENSKKMEIEQKVENKAHLQDQDFPTIEQTYKNSTDAGAAFQNKMKEEVYQGSQFQCPFCQYTTKTYTNRCRNCGEDWGQMA